MPKSAKTPAETPSPAAESAASPAAPRPYNPMAATPEEIAENEHFDELYGKWLMARAKREPPNVGDDDAVMDALSIAESDALRELVTTAAPSESRVWQKIEALDYELDRESRHGERFAVRTVVIVAAIKADLLNFNFGG